MKITVIDYAGTYRLDGPPYASSGKFVQIRKGSNEYLIFSPGELDRYHADIVERFCAGRGIPGTYDPARKRFAIHDPSWAVIGGGKFQIDRAGSSLRLYDNSMAYGRFDAEGLREKILSPVGYPGYEVVIE